MHFLRQVALRAASSASRSLTSAPRSSRQFSSRIAVTRPAPLSSLYGQRRFASDDAAAQEVKTEEVAAEEAQAEAVQAAEVQAEEVKAEEVNAEESVAPVAASTTQTAMQQTLGLQSPSPKQTADEKIALAKRTLYIGNIYFAETEETIAEFIAPVAQPVEVRVIRDVSGRSRGFGFVTFADAEAARRVHEKLNLQEFAGRPLVMRFQTWQARTTVQRPTGPTSTIYIRNIDSTVSDRELNDLFRPLSRIRDVRVAVNRRTGLPRGFAHADFQDVESATAALEVLRGYVLKGKELTCDYSLPAKPREPEAPARTGL